MLKKFLFGYFLYIGRELGKKRESAVLDILPEIKNGKYLDLGCGDGQLTIKRAEKIGTKKIYGIEILDSEIKKATSAGIITSKSNLNEKFPYKNNEFDILSATQVIEHILDVDLFVEEIRRVLKQGGIFVVSTENLASLHNIAALALGLQPSTGPWISNRFSLGFHPLYDEHIKEYEEKPYLGEMNGHTRVMAYRTFKQLFEAYGFKVVDEKAVGYYPFPSFIADLFSRIDPWHSVDVILKVKKL